MNIVDITLRELKNGNVKSDDEANLMLKCHLQDTEFLIQYWCLSNPDVLEKLKNRECKPMRNSHECMSCGYEMTYNCVTSDLVCHNCGACSYNSDMGYEYGKKPIEEMTLGVQKRINRYKRMTNLKTILRNLQAYCSPLGKRVYAFIAKNKPFSGTMEELRDLLKSHGLSGYNQKIHLIASLVSHNYKPLVLTREQYRCIYRAFYQIVYKFETLKMENKIEKPRKNFISYHLALYFICTDLEYDHVLPHLILPKGCKTVNKQIMTWRNIVN